MLREGAKPRGPRAEPLRVAVLCSEQAPGLAELLKPEDQAEYKVVGLVTTDSASNVVPQTAGAGIPCLVHDIREFYREREARLRDLAVRRDYDAVTVRLLARLRPDLVALSGYRYILTDPVLSAYPHRVINVHDADLSIIDASRHPKYGGLHSTRDAVFAGECETRSTLHLVTPEVNAGPLLLQSWGFEVHAMAAEARGWNAIDLLKAYAQAQREWMMRAAWGRLLKTAVEFFAWDAVRIVGERAFISGIPGPLTLDRSPRTRDSRPSAVKR